MSQLKTPSLTAQFSYDPQGRRVSYTKGSTLKTYFYQGLSMLSDGSSTFLDGAGIDEHLQVDSSTGSQAYLNDHLGSTSQLLDALNGGSNKAKYDYKSYGKLEGDLSNPSASNPYTYTGREDDGTGLYYYRARYYDPELEVFISQDPLGDAQRYVNGNPVGFMDPRGLQAYNPYQDQLDPGNVNTAFLITGGLGAGIALNEWWSGIWQKAQLVSTTPVLTVITNSGGQQPDPNQPPKPVPFDPNLLNGSNNSNKTPSALNSNSCNHQYFPAPKTLPGFPDAIKVKQKAGRARWKTDKGDILEWDYQHGHLERYNSEGTVHKGSYDLYTGEQVGPSKGYTTPK